MPWEKNVPQGLKADEFLAWTSGLDYPLRIESRRDG